MTKSQQAAKETAPDAQLTPRELVLSAAQWSELDTAIPDLIEMVNDVSNIFFDMAYQDDLNKPGINSMMRLAARAIQSFEGKEIQALDRLDYVIRHSKKGSRNVPKQ